MKSFSKTGWKSRHVKAATELAQQLFTTLLITFLSLLLVDTVWEESVSSYLNLNYLIIATIIIGALAVWLNRYTIDLEGETEKENLGENDSGQGFREKLYLKSGSDQAENEDDSF